jgi:hypothetical protein
MYTNWEDNSMYVVDTLKWYPVSKVVEYLHELRKFIIETPGKYGASYLPRLEDIAEPQVDFTVVDAPGSSSNGSHNIPASKDNRFPDEICYICEAIGEWGVRLDKLALAANIMVNPNRLERKYPDFDTAGVLEHYAIVSINQLLHMVHENVSFVNQEVFEERYGLKWLDSEEMVQNGDEEGSEEVDKKQDGHADEGQALNNSGDTDDKTNKNDTGSNITNSNDADHNANKGDNNSSSTNNNDNENK